MSKTLLYRLFKIGRVPPGAVRQIQREGVVLQDEGISGSVTFRQFRAPGKYFRWRRTWFSGSIVLTREHFLAFRYSKPIIGVAWTDDKMTALRCSLDDENTLCIGFEASTFHPDSSGEIEVRFTTPMARALLETIQQNTA